jgi:hypothetical protein
VIVVDPLFDTTPFTSPKTPKCFRNTLSCHMVSTLPGDEGRLELISFARKIGLRSEWLQYPGSKRQHFDLVQSKRALAIKLGAREVSRTWVTGEPVDS